MRSIRFQWPLVSLGAIAVLVTAWTLVRAQEAAADSALCHFSPMAGVVNDAATHLTWQQTSSGMAYTWDEAAQYCTTLELNGTGWRLPSVKELHTLVDTTKAMPAADPIAFPATLSENYWTSSQVANFAKEAWAVNFAYGYDAFFEVHAKHHVRCVR